MAERFPARVRGVPADKWDTATPCDGWVARDVVRHLAEWVPPMFAGTWGLALPVIPSVDDDPVAAWDAVNAFCQSALDDAAVASDVRDTPMGTMSFEDAFAMIALSDVVIHTWDLAGGVGLGETLEPAEVACLLGGMKELPAEMRGEWFGAVVEPPANADDQTRMLAYSGRKAF
mgnify:CR=1 FL=1